MLGMSPIANRAMTVRRLLGFALAGAATLYAQSGPQLSGSLASLTFNIVSGASSNVTQQNLTVTSTGAAIAFAAVGVPTTASAGVQWLTVSPLMNTTPSTLTVSVNTTALPIGQYQGSVNIAATDSSGAILMVPVTLNYTASGPPPGPPPGPNPSGPLVASTPSMTFNVQTSNSNDVLQKNVTLTSTGAPISFAAVGSSLSTTDGSQWLSVSPLMNTTPATLAVSVNASALATGQYQGSVNIAATDSSGASLKIPVTLNYSPSPLLDLNPSGLAFNFAVGGANPPDQFITPTSTTPGLPYTVAVATSNGGSWLSATSGGQTPSPVDVAVNPAGLQPGTYSGTLTFTAAGVANSPLALGVTLTVTNNPALTSNPTASAGVVFNYQIGQGVPALQTVSVDSNMDPQSFSLSSTQNTTSNGIAWLLVGTPTSTNTPATFTVGVNPVGLNIGQYTGTLALTAAGANPLSIPVTLNVSNVAVPLLSVNPQSLQFTAQGANVPSPQAVTVSSTGASVTYTTSESITTPAGGSWLLVSAPSGPAVAGSPSTFFVGISPTSLPTGTYSGTVTVVPNNGSPSVVIPVTLIAQ